MSSLAAAGGAGGYYIPNDATDKLPSKPNQYLKSGVIRFELPMDGFCTNDKCNRHMGRGLRFNAKKEHVDNYFTTKIWAFHITCKDCKSQMTITTDPQNRTYKYGPGIKKRAGDNIELNQITALEHSEGIITNIDTNNNDNDKDFNNAMTLLNKEKEGEMLAAKNFCTC